MNSQTKSQLGRVCLALAPPLMALLLLALGLCLLQQPAYSQGITPQAPESETNPDPLAPDATCDPANPLPGQTARLFGDDEILFTYRYNDSPKYLRNTVIDLVGGSLVTDTVHKKDYTDSLLSEVWWLAATAADYTGDRHAELVIAFQNKNKNIGGTSTQFDSSIPTYSWYSSTDRNSGDSVDDVDVASGNLDAADTKDEVVVAYRDDFEDLHFHVFKEYTGSNTSLKGALWFAAETYFDTKERGNVHHVAVETGDLDGDGTDEIVTAFKDSGSDLQIMVLKYVRTDSTSGTLSVVSEYDSYDTADNYSEWNTVADSCSNWGNKRPIDVTTGDLDGDMRDEVVIGFRNGGCTSGNITLLVTDYISQTNGILNMDHRVNKKVPLPTGHSDQQYEAANNVSLSAGDLDGDGYDEIALGYTELWGGEYDPRRWQTWLETYEYLRANSPEWQLPCGANNPNHLPCLVARPGTWSSGSTSMDITTGEAGWQALEVVATGDLNQDGKDEVVIARNVPSNGDTDIWSFDTSTGMANTGFKKIDSGGNEVYNFWLDMGDQDGNSHYGTYNGNCYSKGDALIQAVIHAPPYWPAGSGLEGYDNEWRTKAGFGKNVGGGGGSGKSVETTIGGSATLGFEVPKINIGPSFTSSWEHTTFEETQVLTTTKQGVGTETTPKVGVKPGEAPTYENTMIIDSQYWCYEYTDVTDATLGTIPVCVPRPELTTVTAKKLDWWYEYGPEAYPDSWVPLGINLAQGRAASQSSTWANGTPHGDAWRAVDGETKGTYYDGSVSCTYSDPYAWWQVDMGGKQWMDAIQIWNRTDTPYNARTANFYVFVTNEKSFSSNDPNILKNDPNVWYYYFSGVAGQNTIVPVNRYGRLVRIQLDHQDALNLAEVQVYGMPGTPDQWPIAPPIKATDAFTLTWRDGHQQKVDAKVYYTYYSPYISTGQGSDDLTFDLGAGIEKEDVTGSGDSEKFSVGMEIKMKGGSEGAEAEWGNSWRQSNVLTWNADVEFSGVATGLDTEVPEEMGYTWGPYVWLQEIPLSGGGKQNFLVLDYFVTDAQVITPTLSSDVAPKTHSSKPAATPLVPLIESSTHPDENSWYSSDTATFTWAQPPGDPATIESYHWYLNQTTDTIPLGFHLGLSNTKTYAGLEDGVWYLHLRAMSDSGEWSETGHRRIQVDAKPPQVSLAIDPPWPGSVSGWYVTPVTVTVNASDANGSGVTSVEVSTDGTDWQPYTTPLVFSTGTPGTTIYARATDDVGNLSTPVTTTIQIDLTPPDSHVTGGAGPGTWVAEVLTNDVGNQTLVLAGAIADDLSGRAGMDLEYDGIEWTGATGVGSWYPFPDHPEIEVNWYYTVTHQIGAGYHLFTGRAFDAAGNQEAPYEIARVLWPPKASPDIASSGLSASPETVRPGEQVTFTLVARNAGFQEAHVAIADTLPEGMIPVIENLPSDVVYDPATRTLTWPSQLLWPGQWAQHSFQAQVDASLGAATLENQATFHSFWPNTDLLPPEDRQQFTDREQTVVATTRLEVNPNLPVSADVTAPWAILEPPTLRTVKGSQASLGILAAPDARWMYLREWTPDPTTGAWMVRQNSGWIDYSRNLIWNLSSGQGVKYLGVWVADAAGNVSTLDEHSLEFVNRMDTSQTLADGQRVQYRGQVEGGEFVTIDLTTVSGDPDMFIWKPLNAFWPDANTIETIFPGQVESASGQLPEGGRYLMEVQAVGASEYVLNVEGQGEMAAAKRATLEKEMPQNPLTVSDPLSAGQVGASVGKPPITLYLPMVVKQ